MNGLGFFMLVSNFCLAEFLVKAFVAVLVIAIAVWAVLFAYVQFLTWRMDRRERTLARRR